MICKTITNDIIDDMLRDIEIIKFNSYTKYFKRKLSND